MSNDCAVQHGTDATIPGLFAAGKIIGGLYHQNDASGTGLMPGAVVGRIAGRTAAGYVQGS
ncbi:MAG: hypothetical protein JO258_17505 [Alphaproteobacteria bacterium]|nr:hypothetical protein [Alphaproteobacteria bacterium]